MTHLSTEKEFVVLRVAVSLQERVLDERLFQPGEAVYIGSDWTNSFALDGHKYPQRLGTSYPLFSFQNECYRLHFCDEMDLQIQRDRGEEPFSLGEIVDRLEKMGDGWSLPLQHRNRGVVVVGAYRFVFQFVRKLCRDSFYSQASRKECPAERVFQCSDSGGSALNFYRN